MRILALETSDLAGSVAALCQYELVESRCLPPGQRSAQALAPTIELVLKAAGWMPGQIELVAVTIGPGSFTGLRVGVTTAKTLAYATGAAVLGVDTLTSIAFHTPPAAGPLQVVLGAHRKELFAASFHHNGHAWQPLQPTHLIPEADWLATLAPGHLVTGPAVQQLAHKLPSGVELVAAPLRNPRAETVGKLALQNFLAGQRHDLWQLVPAYFRPSAAEEQQAAAQ